jgi:hypothetical protein
MYKIKFSHVYKKLTYPFCEESHVEKATLLEVLPVELEKLSKTFIDYDTDKGVYPLPKKGQYILLLFQKGEYGIFPTMRRYTPNKWKYYKDRIGKEFVVEITK